MRTDPLQIVASTADPAFATDEEGRVVIWNKAAERLLGRRAEEVLGRPCSEVLEGRDVFGNRFCYANCPLHRMVRDEEPIRSFEMSFQDGDGRQLDLGVSIIAVPGPKASQYSLVHLLRTLPGDRDHQATLGTSLASTPAEEAIGTSTESSGNYSLTPREIEILQSLVKGWSTQEIADRLYISVATVRNHVQNILKKLDVHSKVEAVSLALRERLI